MHTCLALLQSLVYSWGWFVVRRLQDYLEHLQSYFFRFGQKRYLYSCLLLRYRQTMLPVSRFPVFYYASIQWFLCLSLSISVLCCFLSNTSRRNIHRRHFLHENVNVLYMEYIWVYQKHVLLELVTQNVFLVKPQHSQTHPVDDAPSLEQICLKNTVKELLAQSATKQRQKPFSWHDFYLNILSLEALCNLRQWLSYQLSKNMRLLLYFWRICKIFDWIDEGLPRMGSFSNTQCSNQKVS